MPAFTVELHSDASAELQAAYDWYRDRNPLVATAFFQEIDHAVDMIREHPDRWPLHIAGTRRYILRRFPFSVVFRVSGSKIVILAFAHGRRRPTYWRHR